MLVLVLVMHTVRRVGATDRREEPSGGHQMLSGTGSLELVSSAYSLPHRGCALDGHAEDPDEIDPVREPIRQMVQELDQDETTPT